MSERHDVECGICRQTLYHPSTLICQHNFCYNCINNVTDKHCPFCRTIFLAPIGYNLILDNLVKGVDPTGHDESSKNARQHNHALDEARREVYNNVLGANVRLDGDNDPNPMHALAQQFTVRRALQSLRIFCLVGAVFSLINVIILFILGAAINNALYTVFMAAWITINIGLILTCLTYRYVFKKILENIL